MKKITLIAATLLIASGFCFAQKIIRAKNVNLNDPESIKNDIPNGAIYIFDEFTDGTAYFKNGTTSSAKFNYNTLFEEMQFINDKNEVLNITNSDDISFVKIGDSFFYHLHRCKFVKLLVNENIMLLAKRKTECVDYSKIGAFGQPSSTTAITQLNPSQYKFAIRQDLTFKVSDEFYVRKGAKMSKITSKSAIIKAFPEYKNEINEYLKKKDVDLKNEQDLIKLVRYFNQLKKNES